MSHSADADTTEFTEFTVFSFFFCNVMLKENNKKTRSVKYHIILHGTVNCGGV